MHVIFHANAVAAHENNEMNRQQNGMVCHLLKIDYSHNPREMSVRPVATEKNRSRSRNTTSLSWKYFVINYERNEIVINRLYIINCFYALCEQSERSNNECQ